MYQIAICEPDEVDCAYLLSAIQHIVNHRKVNIACFHNSNDLLTSIKKHPYHLIFIAILIYPHNGITIACMLRDHGYKNNIVFVSVDVEYVLQAFDVHAFQYLIKPVDYTLLKRTILDDMSLRNLHTFFILSTKQDKIRIYYDDIKYVESDRIYVLFHLDSDIIRYHGKLSDILMQLPNDTFIRCHQSYILNLHKIKRLKRYSAITLDNISIPISKAYTRAVRDAFIF